MRRIGGDGIVVAQVQRADDDFDIRRNDRFDRARPFAAYYRAWLATYAREMRERFGGDPFPYGVEENRPTWEQMALYAHQQGIAHYRFTLEEIFPEGIATKVVI